MSKTQDVKFVLWFSPFGEFNVHRRKKNECDRHSSKLHFQTENSALSACESQTAASNQLLLIKTFSFKGVTPRLWALLMQMRC